MTRGRGTGSQVLSGSGFKDGGNIIQDLDREPAVCVNIDTLDFMEED